jgi:hypothetical protein
MIMKKVFRFRTSEENLTDLETIAKSLQRSRSDALRILVREYAKLISRTDGRKNLDILFGDFSTPNGGEK